MYSKSSLTATVTFNPAIDETIQVENFKAGAVNRVAGIERYAGGKGINIATFISDYGFQSVSTGFLGKENDSIFVSHFNSKNIVDEMFRIQGETRTGIKVIDPLNGETTDINYPGIVPDETDILGLYKRIDRLAESCSIFTVSGSLPKGVSPELYGRVVSRLKEKGVTVIVDASGPGLHEALKHTPDIIKPNIFELGEYLAKELRTVDACVEAAMGFVQNGVRLVVVSMGGDGALFVTNNEKLHARPPLIKPVSTVGAGDAMVAGIVCGIVEEKSLADIARLSTAFSLNAISHIKLGLQDPSTLHSQEGQVTLSHL